MAGAREPAAQGLRTKEHPQAEQRTAAGKFLCPREGEIAGEGEDVETIAV